MGDIRNPRLLYLKGVLLLLLGILAAGMLLFEHRELRTAMLLAIAIWAFCRAYYFAFYVIERYVDATFSFAGLVDLRGISCVTAGEAGPAATFNAAI